jgi:hypothetical protein
MLRIVMTKLSFRNEGFNAVEHLQYVSFLWTKHQVCPESTERFRRRGWPLGAGRRRLPHGTHKCRAEEPALTLVNPKVKMFLY